MEDVPLAITSNTVNKGKKFLEKEQVLDSEDEEPHHHTRLRTRVIAPWNYERLVGGSYDADSDHSAIASSRSYASFQQKRTT